MLVADILRFYAVEDNNQTLGSLAALQYAHDLLNWPFPFHAPVERFVSCGDYS